MNFLKRASLSLWARKGKTLILFATFLVVTTMVLAGVLIGDASARAGEQAKRMVGAEVDLSMDLENREMNAGDGAQQLTAPSISADTLDKMGKSPLVQTYNYTYVNGARIKDLKPVKGDKPDPMAEAMGPGYTVARGALDSSLLPEFKDGKAKLIAGEHIRPADKDASKVLIEERLAKLNNLKVGDRIKLGGNAPMSKQTAEFTVAGIYRDPAPTDQPNFEYNYLPGHGLVTSIGSLNKLNPEDGKGDDLKVGAGSFLLNDPDDLDEFKQLAKATAGSALDQFKLDINDKAVQQMTGPLDSVSSTAGVAMWLIGIAGAAVVALLTALAVKQRHKEFGVLLALGEKRWKLVAQQLAEIVVVAALAVGLSSLFAGALTQHAGNSLLGSEAAAAKAEADSWQPPAPGSTGLSEGIDPDDAPVEGIDPIGNLTVRLDPAALATVAAVGLGIGLLATALPAMSVLRLNPKTILTKGK